MAWLRRLFVGGSAGNEQLTALVAAGLLLLLMHKASFIVWFGATGVHVLAHIGLDAR